MSRTGTNSDLWNIVMDGNNLIHKIVHATGVTFVEDYEKDKRNYWNSLSMTFAAMVRDHADYIDKIFVARDHRSWRKSAHVVLPKSREVLSKTEYKENRTAVEGINWSAAYDITDEFLESVKAKYGVKILRIEGAEADDLMFVFSKLMESNYRKTIIWTNDSDMNQLLSDYVLQYRHVNSESRVLVVTKSVNEKYKELSEMLYGGGVDKSLKIWQNCDRVDCVNPVQGLFTKLVYGDSKDNVPPLFEWKSIDNKNEGKTFKPSATYINKAFDAVGLNPSDISYKHIYDIRWIIKYVKALIAVCEKPTKNATGKMQYIADILDKKLSENKVEIPTVAKDVEMWGNITRMIKSNTMFAPTWKHTVRVFLSNRKLLYLNKAEVPEPIVNAAIAQIKEQYNTPCDLVALSDYKNLSMSIQKNTDDFFGQFGIK